MDIDEVIYQLLIDSFPEYEEGEVLDIIEEFKMPRGLDESSEFEQEVWQKYSSLKYEFRAQQSRSQPAAQRGGEGEAAQTFGAKP